MLAVVAFHSSLTSAPGTVACYLRCILRDRQSRVDRHVRRVRNPITLPIRTVPKPANATLRDEIRASSKRCFTACNGADASDNVINSSPDDNRRTQRRIQKLPEGDQIFSLGDLSLPAGSW